MKTTIAISNFARIYKLTSIGDEIFIENERGEAMTLPERDLLDILDEHFKL